MSSPVPQILQYLEATSRSQDHDMMVGLFIIVRIDGIEHSRTQVLGKRKERY